MFGKEYAKHLEILNQSFGQMHGNYQEKIKKNRKSHSIVNKLKSIYIQLFGIPEIGFQIRSTYFKKILTYHLQNKNFKTILDAGSGIGVYTFWLGRRFKKTKIIGGEIDKDKLKSAHLIKNKQHINNIDFIYLNILKAHKKSIYDLIVCIDVLEHLDYYEVALKNFKNLLKNNGYLFIHVPQPDQHRIFSSFKSWHHQDHKYEGIEKKKLESILNKFGFKIITMQETFGFFGKLAWEINHISLSKSFILAGITFPILYLLALLDQFFKNENGLGVVILAQKK